MMVLFNQIIEVPRRELLPGRLRGAIDFHLAHCGAVRRSRPA
jgi:hypothetical protein